MTDNLTENLIDTTPKPLEKPDTYHDQDKLTRLADNSSKISWLFLALGIGVALIIFYLLYLTFKGQIGIENFFLSLPSFLIPLILALFFWIASRLISEGVYVLMDIEDNTRQLKH